MEKPKRQKKLFTISTYAFSNLSDAEAEMAIWEHLGKLNPNTRIFEIKKELIKKNNKYEECELW